MKWVLILFVIHGGTSVTTAEFSTKEACEVAAHDALEAWGAELRRKAEENKVNLLHLDPYVAGTYHCAEK